MIPASQATQVRHALSVDVEDWYHDQSRGPAPATAEEIAHGGRRVADNLARLFELFARRKTRVTLFVLADMARENPKLVRQAQAAGHEIACHGLHHRRLPQVASRQLTAELCEARRAVEDVAGIRVKGFRAPYFLDVAQLGALDSVADAGFDYDSSFMPLRWSGRAPPRLAEKPGPVRLGSGLWEIPLPLSRLPSGHELPLAAGGFALRGLPYRFFRRQLDRWADEHGPAVVYTHPWEIDPGSPKLVGTPGYVRFFNGLGRARVAARLERLLDERRFGPISDVFASWLNATPGTRESIERAQR